jgi:hypothetical protein
MFRRIIEFPRWFPLGDRNGFPRLYTFPIFPFNREAPFLHFIIEDLQVISLKKEKKIKMAR